MNNTLHNRIAIARINRSVEPVFVPSDEELGILIEEWVTADWLRESTCARNLVEALLVKAYG